MIELINAQIAGLQAEFHQLNRKHLRRVQRPGRRYGPIRWVALTPAQEARLGQLADAIEALHRERSVALLRTH